MEYRGAFDCPVGVFKTSGSMRGKRIAIIGLKDMLRHFRIESTTNEKDRRVFRCWLSDNTGRQVAKKEFNKVRSAEVARQRAAERAKEACLTWSYLLGLRKPP